MDNSLNNTNRFSQIKQILKRYHETLVEDKLLDFLSLLENEIFEKGDQQDIEHWIVRNRKELSNSISYYAKRIDKRDFDEIDDMDSLMYEKEKEQIELNVLNDFEKVFKLVRKKGFKTNYQEIRDIFVMIEQEYGENLHKEVVEREFKRLSSILKNNLSLHSVLKEYIKPPNYSNIANNTEYIKSLLRKFELEWDENKLEDLIEKTKKEVQKEIEQEKEYRELEEFEKYLDSSKITKHTILPEYDALDGLEFESFMKKLFELQGYIVVQTKSSGDQGADLILMKESEKTAVQVKKYSGKVSNKAIQEVVASKKYYDCKKAIVVTNNEFTSSAIRLAISNEVVLWDSNKLKQVINEINGVFD